MSARAPARRALAALGLGAALWLAWGCEPKDLTVEVSSAGAARIFDACVPVQESAGRRCPVNAELNPVLARETRLQLRAFLINGGGDVLSSGICTDLDLEPLLEGSNEQLVAALNSALDVSLGAGLSFDGFEEQNDATLMLAGFAPGDTPCSSERLVVCATFGLVNAGSSTYDVQCAGCAAGRDYPSGCQATEPCVYGVCKHTCILDICQQLLLRAGD